MEKFRKIFHRTRPNVIGMIHVGALPGSPLYNGSVNELVEKACYEAEVYKTSGVDGVMVENMHDVPYVKACKQGPEVVASMTKIIAHVKRILSPKMPFGVQVLAGGNKEAIAIAHCCNLDFVRVEGFVFSHIGDEGIFDACAGEVLRYRQALGAQNVLVFCDIKKKHSSHAITADLDIKETAKAAEFFLSDGVIITGNSTGHPADAKEVNEVKKAVKIPVIVGSGVTSDNLHQFQAADALVVGSYFKEGGLWNNELSKERVSQFMEKASALEESHRK